MDLFKELIELEEKELNAVKNAAEKSEDAGVKTIFKTLEKNIKRHIGLLEDLITQKEEFEIENEKYDINIFTCLDDCECAKLYSKEISLYTSIADYEKELTRKYELALKETKDEKQKEILKYIKKKHNDAQFVMEDMVKYLNKPNEWVESAEFTLREPY